MKALFLILLCVSVSMLAGCGQEGSLYLPHGKSEAAPISTGKVTQ